MVEMEYIIAFSMAVVNVMKKYVSKEAVPFLTILFAIGFNLLNAALFGGDALLAGKEAFVGAGISVGMFVAGDVIRHTAPLKKDR